MEMSGSRTLQSRRTCLCLCGCVVCVKLCVHVCVCVCVRARESAVLMVTCDGRIRLCSKAPSSTTSHTRSRCRSLSLSVSLSVSLPLLLSLCLRLYVSFRPDGFLSHHPCPPPFLSPSPLQGPVPPTDDEIEAAACAAQMHQRILSFPDGYEVRVEHEGASVWRSEWRGGVIRSPGWRLQRLCVAQLMRRGDQGRICVRGLYVDGKLPPRTHANKRTRARTHTCTHDTRTRSLTRTHTHSGLRAAGSSDSDGRLSRRSFGNG